MQLAKTAEVDAIKLAEVNALRAKLIDFIADFLKSCLMTF